MRFCNGNCQSGYRTDMRYGLVYDWRDEEEFCRYCREYVPTNQEMRDAGVVLGPSSRDAWEDAHNLYIPRLNLLVAALMYGQREENYGNA